MPDARPLFLALALEAAPLGVVRLARYAWRRSAYVATLVVAPGNVTGLITEMTWADPKDRNVSCFSRDD